jgi:putative FmdB family regulatory protein
MRTTIWNYRRNKTMPVYEFECPNDGTIVERFVRIGTEHVECPECKGKAQKIISKCTFSLKGGGWYADGYAAKK